MKRTFFISVFLCAFIFLSAGTLTGRIAYVGDGNFRDADDIAANPISIAMFHMFGKADKVVHYTYACHDVTSLAGREAKLKAGVDGAIAKWGALPNAQIFNYKTQKNEAISNLTAAINASSAANLLWIIEAGEPDLIYLAMVAAEEAKRQYVKVVTHHPNNDVGAVYDLSHIMALPGVPTSTKVDIPDQNTNLKKPLADYNWMNAHSDSKVKFLWEQGNIAEQDADYSGIRTYFDPSDAGMAWYVLTGGSTDGGDNACTVTKLKDKINAYAPSTTTPPASTPDIVFFQSEHTTSPLGLWEKNVPGTANFLSNSKNDTILMFTGNNPAGQGSAVSPLTYTFKAPNNGTYRLMIHSNRILLGEASDKCNDFYVKLAGDFEAGAGSYTTAQLQANMKFYFSYGTNERVWTWANTGDLAINGTDVKKPIYYILKAGQTYTLTVSGRSQRAFMDCIVLYNTATVTEADAKAYKPGTSTGGGGGSTECLTINYNQWDLSKPAGYVAQGSLDATRTAVQIVTTTAGYTDQWAAAKYTYTGTAGNFAMKFTSLQETDGESFYKVMVNGVEKLSFQNPRIHGTTVADYTPYEKEVLNVALAPNDVIQIDYKSHSNGLVPEGSAFGYSRARWRSVTLCTAPVDTDGDGITDNLDNCPTTANADQADEDNDKIGDACDAYKGDKDNDGVKDAVDNCPNVANPLQEDDNNDGIGNVCERTHYKYPGKSFKIPGVIEIPYFDLGGQNNAFYDNPASTNANFITPRTAATGPEEVEVDAGGIGAIRNGEWVKYTVDSVKSGIYTIKVSSASSTQKVNYQISLNDIELASIAASATGGWDIIQEFTSTNVKIDNNLTNAVLKVMFVNTSVTTRDLCNFKAFSFERTGDVPPAGISNVQVAKRFSISPNPARNEFYINASDINAKHISIKNAVGAEVTNQSFNLQQNKKVVVNNNLKSGIYFVIITDNNHKTYSEKLIIQ